MRVRMTPVLLTALSLGHGTIQSCSPLRPFSHVTVPSASLESWTYEKVAWIADARSNRREFHNYHGCEADPGTRITLESGVQIRIEESSVMVNKRRVEGNPRNILVEADGTVLLHRFIRTFD